MSEQPQFTIRKTSLDDVPKFKAMQAQSWIDTYPNKDNQISKEWVKNYVSRWTTKKGLEFSKKTLAENIDNPDHLHLVAEKDNEIIGFVYAFRAEKKQKLEFLYVDKKWHGKGVGMALMQKVIDWADPIIPITLWVVSYNERAIAFYKKWGFTKVPIPPELIADKIPNIKMIRTV